MSHIVFKTLVQGSWGAGMSSCPPKSSAPRKKAPSLQELLGDMGSHPAASISPFFSPDTPGSSQKSNCPKAPLSGFHSGKGDDAGFQVSLGCASDHFGICPFLARSPGIQPHVGPSPTERQGPPNTRQVWKAVPPHFISPTLPLPPMPQLVVGEP